MKEVQLHTTGEPLSINLHFGFAHIVSYRLRVWDIDNGTPLLDTIGNIKNSKNDYYEIPPPVKKNNRRQVSCETSIVSPSPMAGDQYSVTMIIRQGDKEIERMTESGIMNGGRVRPELQAVLYAS